MNRFLSTLIALLVLALLPAALFAQQNPPKFAVVIGNSSYTSGLSPLVNPANDANDIASSLEKLGFTVDKVLNGNQEQMENAIMRLKTRLSSSSESYGFFFYAGHGVQSGGANYLIPIGANIPTENMLRNRAVPVQWIMDELNDARNGLNVVVLDACRDNPFSWSRSGTRGLSIVSTQPPDSIVVYATSAGQTASDGEGRNGLFTSHLLKNITTPEIEIMDVFRNTGSDVATASNNKQIPAIYSQVFKKAYLGGAPGTTAGTATGTAAPTTQPYTPGPETAAIGKEKTPGDAGKLWTLGASLGSSLSVPWMITTVHGTLAPFRNVFFELGVDIGFIPGKPDVGYYSMHPFGHVAFFLPVIENKVGLYAGLGGGIVIVSYEFRNEGTNHSENIPVAAVTAGMNLLNAIDISYTVRTNFKGPIYKVSAGYVYRF